MCQYIKNNQGFTLLSTLIALTILMLITSLILPLLIAVQQIESPSYKTDYEWRQFHFYLMNEFSQAQFVSLEDQAIQFRRVNNSGHEVILQDVKDFSTKRVGSHLFSLTGERDRGHAYTKYYSFPIKTIKQE